MKLFLYLTLTVSGLSDVLMRSIGNASFAFGSPDYWAGRIIILLDSAWVAFFMYLSIKEIRKG